MTCRLFAAIVVVMAGVARVEAEPIRFIPASTRQTKMMGGSTGADSCSPRFDLWC